MKAAVLLKVNAETTAKLPDVLAKLDDYLLLNGRCWQGLWSHDVSKVPDDGKDVIPDREKVASDPGEPTWEQMFSILGGFTSCAVAVDQYGGVGKRGYVFLQMVKDDVGQLWQRALNYGPEAWRGYDWRQVSA